MYEHSELVLFLQGQNQTAALIIGLKNTVQVFATFGVTEGS